VVVEEMPKNTERILSGSITGVKPPMMIGQTRLNDLLMQLNMLVAE